MAVKKKLNFLLIFFLTYPLSFGMFFIIKDDVCSYSNTSSFSSWLQVHGDQLLKKYKIVGAAVGTIDEHHLIKTYCYGFADKRIGKKITENSLFQAASVSKPAAAWGILSLVKAKKLHLNDSLEAYLSRWHLPNSPYNKDKIIIEDLLSHTSGLISVNYPGYSSSDTLPNIVESLEGVLDKHSKVFIEQPPGNFNYSGGGYTLLQLLIEEISGTSFDEFMKQEVLNPLNMQNSSFKIIDRQRHNLCIPYGIWKQPIPWRFFTEQAAAGLITSVKDLASFVSHMLDIYSSSDFPTYLMQDAVKAGKKYALGLEVELLSNSKDLFLFHQGANKGWRSGIFFLPNQKQGLIVLTNSDRGTHFVEDIVIKWAKEKSPVEPTFLKYIYTQRLILRIFALLLYIIIGLLIVKISNEIISKRRIWFRQSSYSKARPFFASLVFLSYVLWFVLFYTPYLYPGGWVIISFLPYGFDLISLCVLLFGMYLLLILLFIDCSSNKSPLRTNSHICTKHIGQTLAL